METKSKIFVAGGRGLVGSAIVRSLRYSGFANIVAPTSAELDLTDRAATHHWLAATKPEYVFVAAAKVGGILANANHPAEFLRVNLDIETNLIHGAYLSGVKKLLFLGSSCIYPKDCSIPIQESSLLTGPLEKTNEAYAVAKIAGIKLCDYYRQEHGCDFISAMPTNTFGPHDNFDLNSSHLIPALLHRFHLAKTRNEKAVTVWGTGKPLREFIYIDDLADGCVFLMQNYSAPGHINLGTGTDISIAEIAEMIREITRLEGKLCFDLSKPDGVYRKTMDVSRIHAMGWKCRYSLREGLERTYHWFLDNYPHLEIHPSYHKKPLAIKAQAPSSRIKRLLIHPQLLNKSLDDPETTMIHRQMIQSKKLLKHVYRMHYAAFVRQEKLLGDMPGITLEIGSGGGFFKEVVPHAITSDTYPFPGVDRTENASHLSFKDGELRSIYCTGVLHHIGDARKFFHEASRCLRPGGILGLMEPHMSSFGQFFFQTLHHEANDMHMRKWDFPQLGYLKDANTALPYLIFDRDRAIFDKEFPEFEMIDRTYHTFLLYLATGGVSGRFSAPALAFYPLYALEKLLSPLMRRYLGTMQTIILRKRETQPAAGTN
jgi:GDP-L-fucose synthase